METTNTGILVGLLTAAQKDQLVGQQFSPDSYFNPVQDANENWIISIEEINASDIAWLKELTFIEYIVKKVTVPGAEPLEIPSE